MSYYRKTIQRLMNVQSKRCFYCGIIISESPNEKNTGATIDHVVPRLAGGDNNIANLVMACGLCNSTKQHMDVSEFCYLISCDEVAFNKFLQKNHIKRMKKNKQYADISNPNKKSKWEINLKRIRRVRKQNTNVR